MSSKPDRRTHYASRAASAVLVIAAATVPLLPAACTDNRLPPGALAGDESLAALPRWSPEAPWNASDGLSQVLIEGKIVFETDRAEIRPGSEKVLDTLLGFMNEHVEVSRLRVEGHTDSRSSEEHNQDLAARRALAVCHWLVDRGVDPTRLLAVGFGESKPIAPNERADGRAENRRVEFHVVEIGGMLFNTKDPTAGGLSLQVLSKEERQKLAAAALPKAPPPPAPFKPTGDEVKKLEKNEVVLPAKTEGETKP